MRRLASLSLLARDIADDIQVGANDYVVRTGEQLDRVRNQLGQDAFERWVVEQLPFGIDTARRYRAVYLAVTNLPDAPLPPPHRAMYAVGHGDMPESVEQPCRHVDETVAELVRHDASEVSPRLRVVLEAWLVGAHS